MRTIILGTVAALALTACNSGGSSASSGPVKREAGSWQTDIKLIKADIPGMPPEMMDGMKKMMEGASGMKECLTKEAADKEDITKEMSKTSSQGAQCDFKKKDVSGGKIDVAGTCKAANGQAMDIAMTGTMEPKKTDLTISTKGAVPTGSGQMEMVMQVTSKHVGAC